MSLPSQITQGWRLQWSPPVTGGNTLGNLVIRGMLNAPQWSPPPMAGAHVTITPVAGAQQ